MFKNVVAVAFCLLSHMRKYTAERVSCEHDVGGGLFSEKTKDSEKTMELGSVTLKINNQQRVRRLAFETQITPGAQLYTPVHHPWTNLCGRQNYV
jgi:hypothetical protein